MKGHRKLTIILISCFLLCMMSCQSSERVIFVKPPLPEFKTERPIRPKLSQIDDGSQLPVSVLNNTILLQGYAKELEACLDGWEEFYMELKKEYATDTGN